MKCNKNEKKQKQNNNNKKKQYIYTDICSNICVCI
jgi:hypothetical protein